MSQSLESICWMLLALVLSAAIGIERQIRGKSAGIRTQAIVGLTACLMMLISKYGFSDILVDGITRYDPSRVAWRAGRACGGSPSPGLRCISS